VVEASASTTFFLNILQSKIFHICPWANISRGEAVFHTPQAYFTVKTPRRFHNFPLDFARGW
jgi:hypothetical protein